MSLPSARRFAAASVLAAAFSPGVFAATATADAELSKAEAEVPGAQVSATMMQRDDGAIYAKVRVRDTAADGVCAHGTIRWHHVNGSDYDDYGMHFCGAGGEPAQPFAVPPRDWRAYTGMSVGAFVDGGAPRYATVRQWDRARLLDEANRIMRKTYRGFDLYKKLFRTWPYDWNDNGCSGPTPRNLKRLFNLACEQHDFGYRNYGQYLDLGRTEAKRKWIDDRLREELLRICRAETAVLRTHCVVAANTMWAVLRREGAGYFFR